MNEFARCYHSVERVEFVRSLPCCACRAAGRRQEWATVNAHTRGGGVARKGPYTSIVPLCWRCHIEQHQLGTKTMAARYQLCWADEAEKVEAAWLDQGGKGAGSDLCF